LKWALAEDLNLRFIEQMPLDAGGIWDRNQLITADEIFAQLSERYELTPVEYRGSAPAEEFLVNGGPATVGIIGSVSRPFCGACDRIRITSDGQLRSCLFSMTETDLRAIVRSDMTAEAKQEALISKFHSTVKAKLPGHGINDPSFIQPTRPMSAIGG
jgi:cyclic pyranopterin phosphate synthase